MPRKWHKKSGFKQKFGLKTVDVYVRGPGPGRESAVRAVGENLIILRIVDKTKVPHNG